MPITFESIKDPYGIQQASGVLGQALMQRGTEERQKSELKQTRKENASAFQEAMATASKPGASKQEQIAALQNYAALSGDNASVAPMIKQILSEGTKEKESQNTIDFMREQGIDIPYKTTGKNAPPASFLGQYAKGQKKTYEPESEKLEAQRTATYADRIVKNYEGSLASERKLDQMELAADSNTLPKPLLVAGMEFAGLPLGILGNPEAELYDKNVNEYIKNISNFFPGAIRVAEIEPYMKTIPTLLNSDAGKKLIIQNQKLENELHKDEYNAYVQILKDNGGKKPQNLDVEIITRTAEKRADNGMKFRDNMLKAIQMTQNPTGKVAPGTQMPAYKALDYLKAHNGDEEAAKAQALKDGYVF
jgi:hypothetical protein